MKNNKIISNDNPVKIVFAYNTPDNIFEGIPVKYRSLFDFDVALIKEKYSNAQGNARCVTLHKAYFEVQ
ncbi:MAG: hypothetical protein ACRBHB_21290 [Arenicella sp.]